MLYLILAEICLTVGTPMWAVYLSYVCFGIHVLKAIVNAIAENME